MFTMATLLIHSDDVPESARDALRAAAAAPPAERSDFLEAAARILYHETDLDCGDVRELVGLSSDGRC